MYVKFEKQEYNYLINCVGSFGEWLSHLYDDDELENSDYDTYTIKLTVRTMDKLINGYDDREYEFEFDDKDVALCGHVLTLFNRTHENKKLVKLNDKLLDEFTELTDFMRKCGEWDK